MSYQWDEHREELWAESDSFRIQFWKAAEKAVKYGPTPALYDDAISDAYNHLDQLIVRLKLYQRDSS